MVYMGQPSSGFIPIWSGTEWVPGAVPSSPDTGNSRRHNKMVGSLYFGLLAASADTGVLYVPDPLVNGGRKTVYDSRTGYVWTLISGTNVSRYLVDGQSAPLTQENGGTGLTQLNLSGPGSTANGLGLARGELWIVDNGGTVRRRNVRTELNMGAQIGSDISLAGSGGTTGIYPSDNGFMWITRASSLLKIDMASPGPGTVVSTTLAGSLADVFFAFGFIWVVSSTQLGKYNPVTNAEISVITIQGSSSTNRRLMSDGKSLYIAGTVTGGLGVQKYNPNSLAHESTLVLAASGVNSKGITFDGRYMWVGLDNSSGNDFAVIVDPERMVVAQSFAVSTHAPQEMAYSGQSVHVVTSTANRVFPAYWDKSISARSVLANDRRVQAGQSFIDLTSISDPYLLAAEELGATVLTFVGTPAGPLTVRWPGVTGANRQWSGGLWLCHNECGQTLTLDAGAATTSVSLATANKRRVFKSEASGSVTAGMYTVP